ncbi:MAG: hypothetical protein PW734_11070 [Verrucomicrobium sp.]|nr:hypothetical protein [Verrucomicrobium sp.]
MKRPFLLLAATLLAGCAHTKVVTNQPVIYPEDAWGNSVPADSAANLREASRLHTYLVNDYVDPNNPRIRHQGHRVDVVEQDETWNLRPAGTMVANLGPVTAASDPASVPNPYTAEFETQLVQQRDQSRKLAVIGTKMSAQLQRLQEMAQKGAATAAENDALKQQVDALQKQVDGLKAAPVTPKTPSRDGSSWFDGVKEMFRKSATPSAESTGQIVPPFRVSVAIREPETPFPAPGITILPGVTIASASLPQEFIWMSQEDEGRIRIRSPFPARTRDTDGLPPLPQP